MSLVLGNGYLAGSTWPTWITFSTQSSTFCLIPGGGSFRTPLTATHLPVGTSGLRSARAASTMTCRFPGPDSLFSSKNAKASLSAIRPVLTHPPTWTRYPVSSVPPSGLEMMDRIETWSKNLAFRYSTGDDGAMLFSVAAASWVSNVDNGISFFFIYFKFG